MSKVMWQKARTVARRENDMVENGRTFWVRGKPHMCVNAGGGGLAPVELCYETQLQQDGDIIDVAIEAVELLPEFAEDVPIIDWDDFVEEKE